MRPYNWYIHRYIPLPDDAARKELVRRLLQKDNTPHSLDNAALDDIVAHTRGYSGADMANLCKEASMGRCSTTGAHYACMTGIYIHFFARMGGFFDGLRTAPLVSLGVFA